MKPLQTAIYIYDQEEPAKDVLRQLGATYRPAALHLGQAERHDIGMARMLVIDVDLDNAAIVAALKDRVLARMPAQQQILIIATPAQQKALTATPLIERARILTRPLDQGRFTETVKYLLVQHQNWQAYAPDEQRRRMTALAPEHREALAAGDEALTQIFAFARGQGPLQAEAVHDHSKSIVSSLADGNINRWIAAVREHHDGTYQHCMLVTGVAVAFGQILCIPKVDLDRLAFAALVHDIGKAVVPVSILDKPGPLTQEEMAVMREHPAAGADIISRSPDIEKIVIDVVRHHHEYLDGSGYPDGLQGDQIPDLVRIVTIADIFGALVEKRSYKPPMSGLAAHDILMKMGPKLDQPLVRVLRAIAKGF